MTKKRKIKRKTHKKNSTLKKIFFTIFTILVITGFAVLAVIASYVTTIIKNSPDIDYLMVSPKKYTTIVYEQSSGKEIDRLHGNENRIFVELNEIPKYLQNAFIATEDKRFRTHNGIDLKGIARAFYINIKSFSFKEGASTLTQQLIKNSLLKSDKLLSRKIKEQYLALKLEKKLSKDQILELYLNTINLGTNCNGVQSASNRYFNKNVSDLTLSESAVIAGITQNPSLYNPVSYKENSKKKQLIVLKKMLEQKMITKQEYEDAKKDDVYSRIADTNKIIISKPSNTSYFIDQVIEDVSNALMAKKGISKKQAIYLIYNGGLKIYTTIDTKIQSIVEKEYLNEANFPTKGQKFEVVYVLSVEDKQDKKNKKVSHYERRAVITKKTDIDKTIEKFKNELITDKVTVLKDFYYLIPQPQSAMVIIDQYTGQVKALVGGRGKKMISRSLNRATQTKRQPGSTFKILASYAPAIDSNNYTLSKIIDDIPYYYGKNNNFTIKNWYSYKPFPYRGLSTVRDGIRDSMNILAVKTLMDTGINKSFNYLTKFGFTSLISKKAINGKIYTDKNPSLALGGITKGVSLLELTNAYATIANKGKYTQPILFTKVLDNDNNILITNEQYHEQVIKESTAFLLTSAMKDVISYGTGTPAKLRTTKIPVAGKTGTTSKNIDLLFVGYTPYYTAGIWSGYDKPTSFPSNTRTHHKLVWKKVMEQIHKGLPYKDFKKPNNIITKVICTESGKLAVEGLCNNDPRGSKVRTEYFLKGTEPTEYCDVHKKAVINSTNNKIATEYTPDETKVEKVFIQRPEWSVYDPAIGPKIADWQYELKNIPYDIPDNLPLIEQNQPETIIPNQNENVGDDSTFNFRDYFE